MYVFTVLFERMDLIPHCRALALSPSTLTRFLSHFYGKAGTKVWMLSGARWHADCAWRELGWVGGGGGGCTELQKWSGLVAASGNGGPNIFLSCQRKVVSISEGRGKKIQEKNRLDSTQISISLLYRHDQIHVAKCFELIFFCCRLYIEVRLKTAKSSMFKIDFLLWR